MRATRCGRGCIWAQHGNRTGHCSGCHETYSGIAAFDAHRRVVDGVGSCTDLGAVRDRAGLPRWKRVLDEVGAAVWKSTAELPDGTFERTAS